MDGASSRHRPMSTNVLLLYAARGIRGFGDGFAIIILPAYLSAIGMNSGSDRDRGHGRVAGHVADDAGDRLRRASP